MNQQIEKPIFKKKDEEERWKELTVYLTDLADKINWNIMTIQNQVETNKKNIKTKQEVLDDNSKTETANMLAQAKFKKIGNLVTVMIDYEFNVSETVGATGTAKMQIPTFMYPTFYDASIPIVERDKVKMYLERDKIRIDYELPTKEPEDEASSDLKGSMYFQYVS